MPELPEVETIARGLAKRVSGDLVDSVWLGQKKEPLKSPAQEIAATLEHSRIAAVRRMGKHIVFDLEKTGMVRTLGSAKNQNQRGANNSHFSQEHREVRNPRLNQTSSKSTRRISGPTRDHATPDRAQWIVHLGMTGRLQVCAPGAELEKHTHAVLKLASGRELRFVDPRRFGRLSVATSADFSAGGIEPLEIDIDRFVELFRGRKTPIKSALLNQKLLRGVGNIYADESLFRAGIRPKRRAATMTSEQLTRLHRSVQEVLREAIALGGSSISDYVDAEGAEGFFQLQHRVYGREGKPCLICKTPIKRVVIAGRSSHYCPKCQR